VKKRKERDKQRAPAIDAFDSRPCPIARAEEAEAEAEVAEVGSCN
jgi:hypothetical protein